MQKSNTNSLEIDDLERDTEFSLLRRRLVLSFFILLILVFLSTGKRLFGYSLPEFLSTNSILLYSLEMILSLAVIIINRHFFISGILSIIRKNPNTDALVFLGAISAFIYSAVVSVQNIIFYGNMSEYVGQVDIYFETSAMILTFISLGKLVEEQAKDKTTDSINNLVDMTPKTALLLTSQGEKEVPIDDVKKGDIFVLKPGMRVPVDGVVESGNSAIDESSLTGESIPVDKTVGSKVSAATINMSGYLTCKATEVGEDTTFSHIIQMVKDASNGKVVVSKISDRVTKIIIPIVILIALITFVCWMIAGMGIGFALSRAIAVLIISCPCALGLSTPVSVMVGSSMGAKHGILYKSAQALENTGKTQIVVVDKTGTITTGQPKVTDIISTVKDMEHRDLLLSVAYSIESKSEHPLAKAICVYAQKRYIEPLPTSNFTAVAGKGIKADILLGDSTTTVYAGNEAYIAEILLGVRGEEDEELFDSVFSSDLRDLIDKGRTPIIFATKRGLLGVIGVADEVRKSSIAAVSALHKEDIHVVMVTGDRFITSKGVGDEIGINREEILSDVLPKDKADIVNKLRETGKVAMIGDGINDAPALSSADIGIAIGAGTDVAIDAADVVLVKDDLTSVVEAIRLSRLTKKIINQNLFWTFFYNILGIPLAAGCFYKAFGWQLNPIICAIAMTISSIIVILNALRLFKYKALGVTEDNDNEEATDDNI